MIQRLGRLPKQPRADPWLKLAGPGGSSVAGSCAHAAPGFDRIARQEIRRAKASAAGTLQFAHGKSPFAASYDQTAAVRTDDGARGADVARCRLSRPDLDRLPGQRGKGAGEGVERPHLAIDGERGSLPIDGRVVAGDFAGIARAVLLLRESIEMAIALESVERFDDRFSAHGSKPVGERCRAVPWPD